MQSAVFQRVVAQWDPRPETTETIADRFIETIDSLGRILPTLADWRWTRTSEVSETCDGYVSCPLAEVRTGLAEEIAANACSDERGAPDPGLGYLLSAMASSDNNTAAMTIQAGATGQHPVTYQNRLEFELRGADRPLATYSAMRAVLLAVAFAWDVKWAQATHRGPGAAFTVDCPCMSYVASHVASRIALSTSISVEHLSNGGLFLAATDEIFDPRKVEHLDATRCLDRILRTSGVT